MKIVAQFFDDGEYWFFDKHDPPLSTDHDPASGSFVIEVAEADATAYFDAVATMHRLADELPVAAGLAVDVGRMAVPCGHFESHLVKLPVPTRDFRRCDTCGHYADGHEPTP